MIKQHPLILLTPIKSDHLEKLKIILKKINDELKDAVQHSTETEFNKGTTLHYGRWVILCKDYFRPEDNASLPVPYRLIFSTNFDGDENFHLTELSSVLAKNIDEVYECCDGYPEPNDRTPESRKNYLKQWGLKTSAFFNGAPGRSLPQIKQEKKLRDYIWQFLSKNNWKGMSAVEIHKAIRKEIDSKSEFEWSKQKAELPKVYWLIPLAILGVVLLITLFITGIIYKNYLLLVPFIILVAPVLYIRVFHELSDKYKPTKLSEVPDKLVERLVEDEDLFPQNQFTQVAVMKPGLVRLLNFKMWMLRTRLLATYVFVKGKLLNIPTIHFARWVLFDNNKHVLFFSNFDGNWQQYLGDFIDQSGWGLTGIFSNTKNFPPTRFMITGGAYDEAHFLAWSRSTQVPTQVWYSPYKDLSIKNINNNTKIRNELRDNLNEEEAQFFLKRIA